MFNCTEDLSLSSLFVPRQDQIVTAEYDGLVGEAFTLDYDSCYLATPIVNRIDHEQKLFLNEENSKRIQVVDAGELPYFVVEPILEWYVGVSEALEIPFSEFDDPEDALVFLTVKLRQANKFAYFDYDTSKIVIERNATTNADIGDYPITLQLTEFVNGVQL